MGAICAPADIKMDLQAMDDPKEACVFGSRFVNRTDDNVVLSLKWNIFYRSKDVYSIINIKDKSVHFKCKGSALSWTEKRVIFDAAESPLFMIKESVSGDAKVKVMRIDGEGKPQNDVYKIGSTFGNAKQFTIDLKNEDANPICLNSQMGIALLKGAIWYGDIAEGTPIAQICSPAKFKDILGEDWTSDDFLVEIAPGVDMALILSMVLAYAQIEENCF
mmetsp:Transcript_106842/g.238455  ORF Transcript_106842/g.238455 Transcript_106842/m.238455 type:complete len:219 (-) Transcript_106842:137-793(-)